MKYPFRSVCLVFVTTLACSGDDGSEDAQMIPADAGVAGEVDAGSPAPSRVRVAHLSPDAAALDFCLLAADGSSAEPVLERIGLSSGVAYGQVTPYLTIPGGLYTVRITRADATTCNDPVLDVPNVAVPDGGFDVTAGALGYATPGREPEFELVFWPDNNNPPSGGQAKIRFIHAAPGAPSLDFGWLVPGQALLGDTLFDQVPYTTTGVPFYVEVEPLTNGAVRVQRSDSATVGIDRSQLTIDAGEIATIFAVDEPAQLRLLVCLDSEMGGACGES